ncbi:hypothetical protein GCM10027425_31250 [Alteromonas gracilis]
MGNHRADRRQRAVAAPTRAGGRRKATRRSTISRHPLTGLPLIPTVAGSIAIAVAAGGAMTAGGAASATTAEAASSRPVAFNSLAAVAIEPVLDTRTVAISRDSMRDAKEDAAAEELQDATEVQARQRNAFIANLARSAEKQAAKIKQNLWQLPIDGGYRLTARFGMAGGLWSSDHTGLDFAAPLGTPIVSVANATITEVGYAGAYGLQTVAVLEDGTEVWYNHQSGTSVQVGDVVNAGEVIGSVGSTGNSTGPHLHLEVRPGGGDPVDPYTALVYHGLQP